MTQSSNRSHQTSSKDRAARSVKWLTRLALFGIALALLGAAAGAVGLIAGFRGAHFIITAALGVGLSTALWAGLLALSFFSAKEGYDEAAHWDDDPDRR